MSPSAGIKGTKNLSHKKLDFFYLRMDGPLSVTDYLHQQQTFPPLFVTHGGKRQFGCGAVTQRFWKTAFSPLLRAFGVIRNIFDVLLGSRAGEVENKQTGKRIDVDAGWIQNGWKL